jgi:hypothetical protein
MGRLLNELDDRFRVIVYEFLARCIEVKIPVLIVTTGRTIEEQREAVKNGTSWTMNSKHLPQPPDGLSLAIDVCPYEQYQLHGPDKLQWNAADPAWQTIGAIGRVLGMKWGITLNGKHIDLGHFEYIDE